MQELKEIQKSFQIDAANLGDYQLMTKTELANGYCDAEEARYAARLAGDASEEAKYDTLRSHYYSALMLRYWYKIFEWIQNSSSLRLDPVDFVDWLNKGLYVTFYYRTWRWEYKAICREGRFIEWELDENGEKIPNPYYWVNDPNAPDKMINRCCGSIRGREYQYHNKLKRKGNVQTYSLDSMVDENGDSALDFAGAIYEPNTHEDACRILVTTLLSRGEGIEALIIDGIANYDTFKDIKEKKIENHYDEELGENMEKEYIRINTEFSPRKLVKHLNEIDERFILRFCDTYKIEESKGKAIYEKLKTLTNTKLYKIITKLQQEVRNTPELLGCLT